MPTPANYSSTWMRETPYGKGSTGGGEEKSRGGGKGIKIRHRGLVFLVAIDWDGAAIHKLLNRSNCVTGQGNDKTIICLTNKQNSTVEF